MNSPIQLVTLSLSFTPQLPVHTWPSLKPEAFQPAPKSFFATCSRPPQRVFSFKSPLLHVTLSAPHTSLTLQLPQPQSTRVVENSQFISLLAMPRRPHWRLPPDLPRPGLPGRGSTLKALTAVQ